MPMLLFKIKNKEILLILKVRILLISDRNTKSSQESYINKYVLLDGHCLLGKIHPYFQWVE